MTHRQRKGDLLESSRGDVKESDWRRSSEGVSLSRKINRLLKKLKECYIHAMKNKLNSCPVRRQVWSDVCNITWCHSSVNENIEQCGQWSCVGS